MTVQQLPRTGLTKWTAGSDPFTRAQMNADRDAMEATMAIDTQGTLAVRPASGKRGRSYYATDTGQQFRDTGSAWVELPTLGISNSFTAAQQIISAAAPQLTLDSATTSADSALFLKRRTAADGSTYRDVRLSANANVGRFQALSSGAAVAGDISGMNGHWGINHGLSGTPADLLVIKNPTGAEVARFTDSGFLGIGTPSPARPLDIRTSSLGVVGFRLGGPAVNSAENALNITPVSAGQVVFAEGAEFSGGTSTARYGAAAMFDMNGPGFGWYANSGLTVGSTFTRSQVMGLDESGQIWLPKSGSGIAVGASSAGGRVFYGVGAGPGFQGDQSAAAFYSADGVLRGLSGIRSDVAGNASDMVEQSKGGGWRWFGGATERARLGYSGGFEADYGGAFGTGVMQRNSAYAQIGNFGMPNAALVRALRTDYAPADLYLSAGGAFSSVRLVAAGDANTLGSLVARAYVDGATNIPYLAAAGYMVAGAEGPGAFPAFRIQTFTTTARVDNSGLAEFYTQIPGLQSRALAMWAVGIKVGGLYSPLYPDYIGTDGSNSQVNVPNCQQGATIRLTVMYRP